VLNLEELRRGQKCTVHSLVVDGNCDASDYLDGLPDGTLQKIQAVICRLADDGFIPNRQKFNRLESGIYELKLRKPAVRLFCFQDGPDWICTHGDRKPGKRELQSHVARVRALRERYQRESR
jgi:hypothetical protein